MKTWSWLLLVSFFGLVSLGCQPTASELLSRTEKDANNQRSQVARHLFGQVIQNHKTKDATRERALVGLSNLALNQLHDYPLALQTTDLAIAEFGHTNLLRDLRLRASRAARLQLQDPERGMKYLEPLLALNDLSVEELQEIGRVESSLRHYDAAEVTFKRAWSFAIQKQSCQEARELQMDIMQVLALQQKCPEGIEWGKKTIFESCKRDDYSVKLEMAHCYEFEGEPAEAIRIYEEMIKEQPENSRIQFLLANVKKRQKEKQIK